MRLMLALALLVPLLTPNAGALPSGCTFLPAAYACAQEASSNEDCLEAGDGYAFTAIGAGASGVAGVAASGSESCTAANRTSQARSIVVSYDAPGYYASFTWSTSGDACSMTILTREAGAVESPCPAGASPPNPGWGHLLP
jgi:hypothetical protein